MSKTNKYVEMFKGLKTPDRLKKVYFEIEQARDEAKADLEMLPLFKKYAEAEEGLKEMRDYLEQLALKDGKLKDDDSTDTKLVYELPGRQHVFTFTKSFVTRKPAWQRGRISLGSFKIKAKAS